LAPCTFLSGRGEALYGGGGEARYRDDDRGRRGEVMYRGGGEASMRSSMLLVEKRRGKGEMERRKGRRRLEAPSASPI
jgi:hypothetical protein